MSSATEPIVGWRLWKVTDNELHSWAVNHVWQPGENWATCLSDEPYRCPKAPGTSCKCGFWALSSPVAAIRLAAETPDARAVMGLIAGFGTIAVHGSEGFRAERAIVTCLFADEIESAPLQRLWWELQRKLRRGSAGHPHDLSPGRIKRLRPVAERFAVPLVSIRLAISLGLLGELGVQRPVIAELRDSLKPLPADQRHGGTQFA